MQRVKIKSWLAVHTAVCILLSFFINTACSTPTNEQTTPRKTVTVFEGARLIMGDGSVPIENAAFVVEDTHLTQVGSIDDIEIPDNSIAIRVDLTGRTVMPAIIDTHTHLGDTREALIEDLQRKAYYGVGVSMSLGHDSGELSFQIREELIHNAARYRTAGRGITAPEPGRSEIPYWITKPEEGRQAVQELAIQNVDLVKIWVDDRNGMYDKLTPELYGAVIDEAHQQGLRVTAHIEYLEDAKGLLRAGVDAFAHGIRDKDIDDELVALFKEHPNVVLVPNLNNRGVASDLSWLSETIMPEELQQFQDAAIDRPEAQQRFAIQARNLARLSTEGIKIGFGTDGNAGWTPHVEMADMVATGMTPAQVIVAATKNSAELLGVTDAGTLTVGNSADFIVLEANPLDDIINTRRIVDVYLRGARVDREALSAAWTGQGLE